MLLIRKDIRTKIGKQPGETVEIRIEKDLEKRIVKVPRDLQKALKEVIR